MQPLEGTVAVVAGAARGAGRGIARMLGEAGATVYCTGRSSRGAPNTSAHHYAGRPETIEETAEMVDAAGGTGIPVRVDHGVEAEVAALFERVRGEQGRLDVLANLLTGPGLMEAHPTWEQSLASGQAMIDSWLRPHLATAWHAARLMRERRTGLIVEVTEPYTLGYHGHLFFDLAVMSLKRLAYALAEELAADGVTALTITPGFMRTEAVLDHFGTTEATWRDVAERSEAARSFGFAGSETPCFVGRAVAALAADPERQRKTGGIHGTWALAEEYGFTDVDGTRPHWARYFAEHFPDLASAAPQCGVRWEESRVG